MRKVAGITVLALLISGCGSKPDQVEVFIEDGVEVVVSGLEPYLLPDSPRNLGLEEELVIDLEDEEIYDAGLFRLDTFAVNGDGDIYILNAQEEESHIFRFAADGSFAGCFGQNGQGPGELSRPTAAFFIQKSGELLVTDPANAKLVYYHKDGSLARETLLDRNLPLALPIRGGRFVVFGGISPDPEAKELEYPLDLCDELLKPLKNLDRFRIENFRVTRRIQGTQPGFGVAAGGGRIFVGNEARGYEIWVFDAEGTLVRKIRKKHEPVPVGDEIRKKALERFGERARPYVFFPEALPPFRTMTADENGSLYVVTFEPGDVEGENRIHVFDPDGALVGFLSADVLSNVNTAICTAASGGRFYYIREKAGGYKQLVVERIAGD